MTDQKKAAEITDEALEDAKGGFYSMAGSGAEVKRQRKGDGLMSFGNDASTLVDDDALDGNLVSFGVETAP